MNGIIQRLDNIPHDRAKIARGPFAEFICTVDDIQDDQRVGPDQSTKAANKSRSFSNDVSKIN